MSGFSIADLDLPHRVRIVARTPGDRDASGGNTEEDATLASNVPVVISSGSGRRQPRHDQAPNVATWTVTGADSRLARTDVVFLVQRGPHEGRYLRPVGSTPHGELPWAAKFYRATCEEVTSVG